MKTVITSPDIPAAVAPYSPAIMHGNTVYISGQLPIDPKTGKLCTGSIEECTRQSLDNLKTIVDAAGATMDQVVKTTVFMADIKDGPAINAVYAEYFEQPYPSRSAFAVADLPMGARVEIEAVVGL